MSDYPSEKELARIKSWPLDDPDGWLDFIRGEWWAADWGWHSHDGVDDFGKAITVHQVSTGGWSGNEDRIEAMRTNWLWGLTWYQHRVGGHYEFRVRKGEPK